MFNNIFFFRKSYSSWNNVANHSTAGQATDDNMAHAYCVMDTQGYKHTLRMCNTYFISNAIKYTTTAQSTAELVDIATSSLTILIKNRK